MLKKILKNYQSDNTNMAIKLISQTILALLVAVSLKIIPMRVSGETHQYY